MWITTKVISVVTKVIRFAHLPMETEETGQILEINLETIRETEAVKEMVQRVPMNEIEVERDALIITVSGDLHRTNTDQVPGRNEGTKGKSVRLRKMMDA